MRLNFSEGSPFAVEALSPARLPLPSPHASPHGLEWADMGLHLR